MSSYKQPILNFVFSLIRCCIFQC